MRQVNGHLTTWIQRKGMKHAVVFESADGFVLEETDKEGTFLGKDFHAARYALNKILTAWQARNPASASGNQGGPQGED